MLKVFPIDFIRQVLEQKLLQEHMANPNFFGGNNQVNILSFYEQLKSQDEVDRFVQTYRDLSDQQNRTNLILNGVVLAPENPSITNLYSSLIVPITWTCSLRCTLKNRDQSIITINNLVERLKGKKVDIAQLDCLDHENKPCAKPFMVGTIGQNDGSPQIKHGDYIGEVSSPNQIVDKLYEYQVLGFDVQFKQYSLYCKNENKLKVAKCIKGQEFVVEDATDITFNWDSHDYLESVDVSFKSETSDYSQLPLLYNIPKKETLEIALTNEETIQQECELELISYQLVNGQVVVRVKYILAEPISHADFDYIYYADISLHLLAYSFAQDDGTLTNIVFPPEHTSFDKYKVSFSFDAIRCDEPHNLNGKEYCELSFGGSATLVSDGVSLGNDLLKISIHKNKIVASTDINLSSSATYYLEPLEMPSGSNANTQINQLKSNIFKSNTHTDALSLSLQYTFILDRNIALLDQLFKYARYGTQGITINDISPNIIYDIVEYWCSWGNFENTQFLAKIVENVDIENTESDALTISMSMQIQGENN